jgi:hypothetical protein
LLAPLENCDNFVLAFIGVYGPDVDYDRRLFGMNWLVEFAVVCWGEFNIIRFLSERLSDPRSSPAMVEFSEFILE